MAKVASPVLRRGGASNRSFLFGDTVDTYFVFNQKGENTMFHTELTDKIISSFFKVYNASGITNDKKGIFKL